MPAVQPEGGRHRENVLAVDRDLVWDPGCSVQTAGLVQRPEALELAGSGSGVGKLDKPYLVPGEPVERGLHLAHPVVFGGDVGLGAAAMVGYCSDEVGPRCQVGTVLGIGDPTGSSVLLAWLQSALS